MLSQRPSATHPRPAARLPVSPLEKTHPPLDVLQVRVLLKLRDRLDPAVLRRMPASLVRETARRHVEQAIEAEAPRLSRPDRDRIVEEILGEAFGFGPLEELFADPAVKEVAVLGPDAVIARRDLGWVPTNVKFKDAAQLEEVLKKVRDQGEAVGPPLPESVLDVRLPAGFRAVAVIPPPELGRSPTAAFVRVADAPAPTQPAPASPPALILRSGVTGHATRPGAANEHLIERLRVRITERLISKMSALGVYDLSRVETSELQRIVATFVEEYLRAERLYLSDTDQGRLTLEILTGMHR